MHHREDVQAAPHTRSQSTLCRTSESHRETTLALCAEAICGEVVGMLMGGSIGSLEQGGNQGSLLGGGIA